MTNAELVKFRTEVQASLKDKSLEELRAIDASLIKEADELDEKTKNISYDVPTENYKEIASAIREFINRKRVTWQYTMSLMAIYEFWDPTKRPKKVPFPMYAATTDALGDQEFTGYDDWCKVVAINKYIEPISNKYAVDRQNIYLLAIRHSIVLDAIKLLDPNATDIPGEVPVGQD